jgi:hypothetical protein
MPTPEENQLTPGQGLPAPNGYAAAEIGPKQLHWIESLESDTPFFTDDIRKIVGSTLFNDTYISEKEMAEALRRSPWKFFERPA